MKSVIIYYSNSGVTAALAKKVQSVFGSQLAEVKPRVPYGNYFAAVIRAGKERKRKITAEYDAPALNLAEVDVVFAGYPIWYSDAPAFILDFISKLPLEGKTVIPFATSNVSGIKGSLEKLRAAAKGASVSHPYSAGKLFKDDFDKWTEEIKKAFPD